MLATAPEPTPVVADRHLRGPIAQSFSRPHVYLADDGEEYVVKLRRPDQLRALASEQVVGRAGSFIGAAVGSMVAISVEKSLLPPGEPESSAGVGHGCKLIDKPSDGGVMHIETNRARLGSLATLYTWTHADNHQLIYGHGDAEPVVYSVDHGHFLPPSTNWQSETLDAHPDPLALDSWFTSQGITDADCAATMERLRTVTPDHVASIARSARSEWDVHDADRIAICKYLWRRRQCTLALAGGA